MFTIVVGIACLLAGIVLEAKFGGAIKSDFGALKAEVTTLIAEVRGAKAAAEVKTPAPAAAPPAA
jgi:hypothetical protein